VGLCVGAPDGTVCLFYLRYSARQNRLRR
jgi:hypothetical protein